MCDMKPSLYLLEPQGDAVALYCNGISTLLGLKALDPSDRIKLITIGATCYQNFGFATEADFSPFNQVQELIAFLHHEGEIGLIDFEVEIIGKGKMSTHYDGECHFIMNSQKDVISILKKLTPDAQSNLIIATLLQNQGIYISIDEHHQLSKYASFDAYINKSID